MFRKRFSIKHGSVQSHTILALCTRQIIYPWGLVDKWARTGNGGTAELTRNGRSMEESFKIKKTEHRQQQQRAVFIVFTQFYFSCLYVINSLLSAVVGPSAHRPVVPHISDTASVWKQTFSAGKSASLWLPVYCLCATPAQVTLCWLAVKMPTLITLKNRFLVLLAKTKHGFSCYL